MLWQLIIYTSLLFSSLLACKTNEYLIEGKCKQCLLGQFCFNNTARLCEKGHYCPNTTIENICEKFNYCLVASTKPNKCILGGLTCPDEGMDSQDKYLGGLVFCVTLFILINIVFGLVNFYKRIESEKNQKQIIIQKSIQNKFHLLIPYLRKWLLKRRDNEFIYNINYPINLIEYKNINLNVSRKCVLNNVSGYFVSGKINVIIGESGSGKTSLINLLVGKNIKSSKISGEIFIKGKKVKSFLSYYKKSIAYVEQFYDFNENLTVEENLYYYYNLFSKNIELNVNKKVNDLLKFFELNDVRNNIVGGMNNQGISGGQRKKLSLAMELIKSPDIIILDEPLSGLDSASSIKIFRIFEKLTKKGKTIIISIHQPRRELIVYFDYVTILMNGGNLIYCGKKSKIIKYFSDIGYLYNNSNIIDFVIDIVTGILKRNNYHSNYTLEDTKNYLLNTWNNSQNNYKYNLEENTNQNNNLLIPLKKTSISKLCDEIYKFFYLVKRNIQIIFRNKVTLYINFFFSLALSFLISTIYGDRDVNGLVGQFHPSILIISLISAYNGIIVFGIDKKILFHELFNGLNIITVFFSKLFSYFIFDVFTVLIYSIGWFNNVDIRSSYNSVITNYFLIHWVITGISNLLSIFLNKKNMTQIAYLIIVVLWVLNGVNPSYEKLYKNIDNEIITNIFLFITPLNEALKIFIQEELKNYPEYFNGYKSDLYQLYKIDDTYNYKLYLFFYGLTFKILTFLLIYIKYKFKFKK